MRLVAGFLLHVIVLVGCKQIRLRSILSECMTSPSANDTDNVVDDGQTLSIGCSFDQQVKSCVWQHTDPISAAENGKPMIDCESGIDDNGMTCPMDTRVVFRNMETVCAIDVSNTKPEDTGRWKLSAVVETSGGSFQVLEHVLKIYTYNMSQVAMLDEDMSEIDSIDTSYNKDTKEEEWIDNKNGFESVEFSCIAYGGRPAPTFLWYIDSNDNDDLEGDSNFKISTGSIGSLYEFIENYQSTIRFGIDDTLLEKLNGYGIDTNPSGGQFSFNVTCAVTQGDRPGLVQRKSVRINVKRKHDDGKLVVNVNVNVKLQANVNIEMSIN